MDKKIHDVQAIQAEEHYLVLIVENKTYRVPWEKCSSKLRNASLSQRQQLIVSPSGYGIHWLELDEDLAISPLLEFAETVAAQTA